MKVLGIIPARFASTRFPGKSLISIKGKTMIQRVYEQATQSTKLDQVIVATDDQRIRDEVQSFSGKVMITKASHKNGTERCAEVAELLPAYDYVVNIQGDEPFVNPQQIDSLIGLLDGQTEIATLVKKITNEAILDDPGEMKVTFNKFHEALYFSRSCIPFVRNQTQENRIAQHDFYKHIGIYAYRTDILKKISTLKPTPAELAESLEQLRWLEHGFKIKLGFTTLDSQMIDTPEDLKKLEKVYQQL